MIKMTTQRNPNPDTHGLPGPQRLFMPISLVLRYTLHHRAFSHTHDPYEPIVRFHPLMLLLVPLYRTEYTSGITSARDGTDSYTPAQYPHRLLSSDMS